MKKSESAQLAAFMIPGIAEAGCDEAGRGCLCGPVSCAAVILGSDFDGTGLNDSKQLSAPERRELRIRIERDALAWAVVMVDACEIDRINILNASIAGMHRALDALSIRPAHILVDGNRFKPYLDPEKMMDIPHHTIVKGDAKFLSIAAASILAKTHRDELMEQLAGEYPGYGWERNMGYPTKEHLAAIGKLGITPVHRLTFRGVKELVISQTDTQVRHKG
ncbi:MAG: ribonuclease HII [Candidatus Amulumruptor caecigallinarius]|nr:ribonuclease HII [Candidatus Amulumruptor caecigallinarius]